MQRYDDLSPELQKSAVQFFLSELLTDIVEGAVRFNDKLNRDALQKRIDDDLTGMAECSAQDALYSDPATRVVPLSRLKAV